MLFHLQLWHDAAHCPGYHRELIPELIAAAERRDEIASQLGVTIHGAYSALPEHHEILIVEAANSLQLAGLATQLYPSEQAKITVTSITPLEEVVAFARQMSG